MLLTIAICTWNRSALLRQALAQMTSLVIPARVDLEVLVVNNNSTDDTDGVIETFSGRLPIRRLFEPKPGQSNARNTAVSHARGAYVLWTDDDVLVDPNWVSGYADAFRAFPGGVVYGGPILPAFASPPPTWLTEAWPVVANAYAIRDLGAEPLRFDGEATTPFGANFVIRTQEQRTISYDPELGLKPGGNIRGEETDVVTKLLDHGHEGWWVPGARVRHHIPVERMTTGYVRSYFRGSGEALVKREVPDNAPLFFGRPRWAWRQAITAEAAYRLHRIVSPPRVWVSHLCEAGMAWGQLHGARRRG
jgi:glucosyl-dolichyl phosphate glucuronosyltransferase